MKLFINLCTFHPNHVKAKPVSHRAVKYLKHTEEQPGTKTPLTTVNILFPNSLFSLKRFSNTLRNENETDQNDPKQIKQQRKKKGVGERK